MTAADGEEPIAQFRCWGFPTGPKGNLIVTTTRVEFRPEGRTTANAGNDSATSTSGGFEVGLGEANSSIYRRSVIRVSDHLLRLEDGDQAEAAVDAILAARGSSGHTAELAPGRSEEMRSNVTGPGSPVSDLRAAAVRCKFCGNRLEPSAGKCTSCGAPS